MAIAALVQTEADSWKDGYTYLIDGQLEWGKDDEWAHVRWHKLVTASNDLKKMASAIVKRSVAKPDESKTP